MSTSESDQQSENRYPRLTPEQQDRVLREAKKTLDADKRVRAEVAARQSSAAKSPSTSPSLAPEPDRLDKLLGLLTAAVGEAPGGGILTELCGLFMRTPYERRMDEWRQEVGAALYRLETEHEVDVEALQNDDAFIDTVMQASHIAMRNSQAEKREALRNAILNSALPHAPDESRRQMFLHLIDTFTVWHLRLLHLFDDPPAWFRRRDGRTPDYGMTASISTALVDAYPELRDRQDFYEQVWRELHGAGLVNTNALQTTMSGNGALAKRTTDAGHRFLAFISEPAAAS